MTQRPLVITGGTVITSYGKPEVIDDGAVLVRGGRIEAVGPVVELRDGVGDVDTLDARGGLVLPGLVNLHHHFYSALARGLDPGAPMRDFPQILDRLWWRLDRALDEETVRLSAELSLVDSVRAGCTTVFDHHASPSIIGNSLDMIADAAEHAGVHAVLCYEVTDRNGPGGAGEGIEENLRFLERCRSGSRGAPPGSRGERRVGDRAAERTADTPSALGSPLLAGVFGLHASFTLRDATLDEVARVRPRGAGCHVHVAEHPVDGAASREAFGAGPVERLEAFGLLDDRALLAHGIHLTAEEYEAIGDSGATIVHNPESNANNGVGRLDVVDAARHGCAVGLGTDGMSSSMLRALRTAFLTLRGGRSDPTLGFDVVPDLLHRNAVVARRFLDEPLLGELAPTAPGDVIVLDAPPRTPLTAANAFAQLVYGGSESAVRHTVAAGRVLQRDFELTTIDERDLAARARAAAPALWERFRGLSWGTSYLGEGGP
jgi:putative selenium metabolism protein SsnA